MPKPLFLRRSSGLYVRFLIPKDLRPRLQSHFIVRTLGDLRGDGARLVASRMGYALGQVFDELRRMPNKEPPSLDDVLKAARDGKKYEVEMGADGGFKLKADGPEDHARAMEFAQWLSNSRLNPDGTSVASKVRPRLYERIDLFLEQFGQKQRDPKNVLDTTNTLNLFRGIVDDKPLPELAAEDFDRFLKLLTTWPPNAAKKREFKGMSVKQIARKAQKLGLNSISPRTQEKHLDRLRVFLNWCVDRQELVSYPRGLHILTRQQEETRTRRPFTPQELQTLFSPQNRGLCNEPFKFFLPVMALYSGARAQELAQLWTDDLEEINGVWGFHVASRHDGQKVKNAASRRFVPLHSVPLGIGLIQFRDAVLDNLGNGPLFYKSGDSLGDWFNRTYMREHCHIGLDGSLVFHCFRNTFASAAHREAIPDSRIGRITGHSTGSSVLHQHYIDPPTLAERKEDVERVQFNLPSLAPYSNGLFASWFQKQKQKNVQQLAIKARKKRGSRV